MLAFLAIFFVISLIASGLVIAATMLSSRLSHTEDQYLAEEFELEQNKLDAPTGSEAAPPSA